MTDQERIEKLEKENEIMKKFLIMFISHITLDRESKIIIEDLLKQLIV